MVSRNDMVRFRRLGFSSAFAILLITQQAGAEWDQWRGPERDGTAAADSSLLSALPDTGLKPLWLNREDFASGGGWSSPIVAEGRVFQYSHDQTRREDVDLPPAKYPPLTDEQKEKLSPEEQEDYEKNRGEENRQRQAKQFRFTDRIVCLDAKTGQRIWRHERDSKQTRWRQSSTPAVSEGRLYFVGADRHLVCLAVRDGSEQWAKLLPVEKHVEEGTPSPISSSPLVADGSVVVLAERLIALDAKDGSPAWTGKAEQKGAVYSSPALWRSKQGVRIIANLGQEGTVCVDAGDGRELWRVESHAGKSTPLIVGDTLLTYGNSRKGGIRRYEMSEETAELKWTSNRFADQGSSPVVDSGRVFVQGDRYFACVDLEDGQTLWQTTLDRASPRYTSPVASGKLVFYTFGGVICVPTDEEDYKPIFDARIGEEGLLASEDYYRRKLNLDSLSDSEAERIWNRKIDSVGPRQCVSPALADGKLYIRLNQGLACYDLKAGNAE